MNAYDRKKKIEKLEDAIESLKDRKRQLKTDYAEGHVSYPYKNISVAEWAEMVNEDLELYEGQICEAQQVLADLRAQRLATVS